MNSLIDLIINKGSIIDLIIFMMGMAVVAYVGILKHRLDKKDKQVSELKEKYHLLDRHTLIMSHNLELGLNKKLHTQMPHGEWSTHSPLTEN
jgi:hypothetical protein